MGRAPAVYPNFLFHRRGRCKIWLDQSYAEPEFLALLNNSDLFFSLPVCEIIKDQRKVKVGRVVLDIRGESHGIYIKRYNSFSLRHRFGSMFVQSGGVKSLRGAAILNDNGIPTAKPIAAVEERIQGAVRRSFYLSKEILGGVTVDAYWLSTLQPLSAHAGFKRRRVFLQVLGDLFNALHGHSVYHNDLKDANILAVPVKDRDSINLYLLDLEGVRQYRHLSENRRIKNLVQLKRTLGRYLSRTQQLAFLRAYLARSFADRRLKRNLIGKVMLASNQVDATKLLQRTRGTAAAAN
jgi:serine/threonine protein kinase